MKTEIESAIRVATSMINKDRTADEAMKIAQAATNLAHAYGVIANAERPSSAPAVSAGGASMNLGQMEAYLVTASFGGDTAQVISICQQGNFSGVPEEVVMDAMRSVVASAAADKFGPDAAYTVSWKKGSEASLAI